MILNRLHWPREVKNIVILYSELAEYSMACIAALKQQNTRVLLVHWPVNPEAPFQFDFSIVDSHHNRNELSTNELQSLVATFNPSLILCSGWLDKGYLEVCRKYRASIPTVLTMDNHWTGSLKQHIARLVAPFTIRRAFNAAFVPGEVQRTYALKLGFDSSRIQCGFYAADVDKFDAYHHKCWAPRKEMPRRMLFLGRYVEHKGIFDLWRAFKLARSKHDIEDAKKWELWCVGTGDQWANRMEGEGIKHFGFVQPSELEPILKACSVYVLPSHFEPWGVSVQEMAVVGFPLLLSSAIGSKEAFLNEGRNGHSFEAGNQEALAKSMLEFMQMQDAQLAEMSEESRTLGLKNTPTEWAKKVMHWIK